MRGGIKDGVTHKIEVWSEEGGVCVCLSALEGGDLSVTAVVFFFFRMMYFLLSLAASTQHEKAKRLSPFSCSI